MHKLKLLKDNMLVLSILSFLFILSNYGYTQTIQFNELNFKSSNVKDADNIIPKVQGDNLYLLIIKGETNYFLHLNIDIWDTIAIQKGQSPIDFCVDSVNNNLYMLFFDEIIKISIDGNDDYERQSLSIGASTSLNIIGDKLVAVNYVNNGVVAIPKLEIFNSYNLKSLKTVKLISENYNAFYAAISPHQNNQIEIVDNIIYFFDKVSGSIDCYDIFEDTVKNLVSIKHNKSFLDKIQKLCIKYKSKNKLEDFVKLEDIEMEMSYQIIQFFKLGDSIFVLFSINKMAEPDSIVISSTRSNIFELNNPIHFKFGRLNKRYDDQISRNNFSLNEIYTDRGVIYKEQLIFVQSMYDNFNTDATLGEQFLYKSMQKRVKVLSAYKFSY